MKILSIPDTHGRDFWKQFVSRVDEFDYIVFLGDYLDSFDISDEQMIKNLEEIIQFKKDNLEKVILLYGNHEWQYTLPYTGHSSQFSCSGYRIQIHTQLFELLNQNSQLFQNAFQIKNYIWTHAGIQSGWFEFKFIGNLAKNIAEQLNNPKNKSQFDALHHVGLIRGGYTKIGGIFWCDKSELKKPIPDFIQIVGHNPVKDIRHIVRKNTEIYYTDCLGTVENFLILEI